MTVVPGWTRATAVVLAVAALAGVCSGCSDDDVAGPVRTAIAVDAAVAGAATTLEAMGRRVPLRSADGTVTGEVVSTGPITSIAPVAALDAKGEPVALGFADRGSTMVLGAQSTALFLVMGLPGMWVSDPAAIKLLSLTFSDSAAFQALVDEIQARVRGGRPVLTDLEPQLRAVTEEIYGTVEPRRGRSAAAPAARHDDVVPECGQSGYWRLADQAPSGADSIGLVESRLLRFCLREPQVTSKGAVEVPYVQTGTRYTFVMRPGLVEPVAYVPSRDIATTLTGLVGRLISERLATWSEVGFASAKCALSILPLVDCERSPIEAIVDGFVRQVEDLAHAVAGEPVHGSFPLVLDESGTAAFAIAGWGVPTSDGLTTPTAVLNIASAVLTVFDQFGPLLDLLQEIASDIFRTQSVLAQFKRCFSPSALFRALRSNDAAARYVSFIAESRAAVELAMNDDLMGAIDKLDMRMLFGNVVWAGSKLAQECTKIDLDEQLDIMRKLTRSLSDLDDAFKVFGKALKSITIIQNIFDAAYNVGALVAKSSLVNEENTAPDCVAGVVVRRSSGGLDPVRDRLASICASELGPPARTDAVTREELAKLDGDALCQDGDNPIPSDTYEGKLGVYDQEADVFLGDPADRGFDVDDLDGDGVADGAVAIECTPIPAGAHASTLVAVIRARDRTVISVFPRTSKGEPVDILAMQLSGGLLSLRTRWPERDAFCCPTTEVDQLYRFQGDGLVKSGETSYSFEERLADLAEDVNAADMSSRYAKDAPEAYARLVEAARSQGRLSPPDPDQESCTRQPADFTPPAGVAADAIIAECALLTPDSVRLRVWFSYRVFLRYDLVDADGLDESGD